jgi:hypothetical protein
MIIGNYNVSSLTCSHPLEVGRYFCLSCEERRGSRAQISTNRFISGVSGKAPCVEGSLMTPRSIDRSGNGKTPTFSVVVFLD